MTELLKPDEIHRAAELLRQGKLVAFPTETVYGLGAPIFNPDAVQSIFTAKGRPSDNPLIAHIHHLDQVKEIAQDIPDFFYRLADAFFPGPLATVLKKHSSVPSVASAGLDSIAVRMPAHSIASKLLECVGEPLVAPSANLSGKPSSTQAKHVLDDFEGKIAAVIDGGKTDIGIESTVISLLGPVPVLLRPGSISQEAIESVLGCAIEKASSLHQGPVLSPGMKYRHYAPHTPVKLFCDLSHLNAYLIDQSYRQRMFLSRLFASLPCPVDHFTLSSKDFYSRLRHADQKNYSEILILCDEEIQKDAGLMNRLTRCAAG